MGLLPPTLAHGISSLYQNRIVQRRESVGIEERRSMWLLLFLLVLLDGPSGEKASSQDDFTLDLVGLGEKEIHILQKFLKIIRTNPAKAEKMVKEEEKDDLDGSGAQVIRVTDPPSLRSDRGIVLHKRAAEMKMAKKKENFKPKKA